MLLLLSACLLPALDEMSVLYRTPAGEVAANSWVVIVCLLAVFTIATGASQFLSNLHLHWKPRRHNRHQNEDGHEQPKK